MPDSFTHKTNAQNALAIADYKPKNYHAFILGSNGPDPLFSYKMYNPFRKLNLSDLGGIMHNEKTGKFLVNLFRFAQTDAQKDYCLGFLCHYSLDSVMHPYINYITSAYGSPFNIVNGHGYFESSLDSILSFRQCGKAAAPVAEFCPDMRKMYLDQIVTLFKQATEATYNVKYDREEYLQAFKDFKTVKNLLNTPSGAKFPLAAMLEKLMRTKPGFILSHMQPCKREIKDIPVWRNLQTGFFCISTISELLERADYLSADCIDVGLKYFSGIYSSQDLLEDIGNKSYETGVAI